MTKKEVKDELKETEGRPEVKQHIRKKQRELATAIKRARFLALMPYVSE